ncbi:MAG: hypothetical protein HY935_04730, partial [Nitrosomonadales bacterium]|nr:hypothetical protein [Nitrosomonadales bacterium]
MSILLPVKHQQEGMSLDTFSRLSGVSVQQLQRYAKTGRIIGARKHPLTRKWWIYPPAKLLTGR